MNLNEYSAQLIERFPFKPLFQFTLNFAQGLKVETQFAFCVILLAD